MMKKVMNDNQEGVSVELSANRNIFVNSFMVNSYTMYIGELDRLEDHTQNIHIIRTATPNDNIRIIITSYGGDVDIAVAYISAMRESAARITTHAEGRVFSAGTVLWLSGEQKTVSPYTQFMFHNYQGAISGSGERMRTYILFQEKMINRLMDDLYSPVLTKEEMDKVKGSGEVWLDEIELVKRTDAVLLSKGYLDKVHKETYGEEKQYISAEQLHIEEPIKSPEEIEEVEVDAPEYFSVVLSDKEQYIFTDHCTASDLAQFNVKELRIIIESLCVVMNIDPKVDLRITMKTKRDVLELTILNCLYDLYNPRN